MKSILLTLSLAMTPWLVSHAEPLWLRYPSISPDGKIIAFSYQGDIYTVASEGGEARQITSNAAFDSYPVWSPDGKYIAFSSAREGSLDIYLVGKQGGVPKRLTTASGDEIPMGFIDTAHIAFSKADMPSAKSILFANGSLPQTYLVDTLGNRPRLFSALPMLGISKNKHGDILYFDQKGYEDPWRKHHQSPITRDIWLLRGGKHTKLTDFKGEDRSPVWAADGESFFYLSEENGSYNVWQSKVGQSSKTCLTRHQHHPVRFLSASGDNLLCYSYDGSIYTLLPGSEPRKVDITIVRDQVTPELIRQKLTRGAKEITLSPKYKEVAFVVHGDIYVTALDYSTTRRITDTPTEERNVRFSPDGRSLVYEAERDGLWQIYQTSLVDKADKGFTYALNIREERLTNTSLTAQYPQYSPDGKKIAFFEDRSSLCVMDLKTRNKRTVMDGRYNFSYSDGDIWFEWSPDSRWLLASYIGNGGWNSPDVALVRDSETQEIHNLTQSGYSSGFARWALGGKAMLFTSDRAGYRSHGSWGAEDDAYLMFFDLDAYEAFNRTKEEKEIAAQNAKDEAKNKAKDTQGKKDGRKNKKQASKRQPKKDAEKPALTFDLENCRDRIVRLTSNSSRLGYSILSPGGDTLYYQAAFEGGYDLWKHDLREGKTELVMKNVGLGSLEADRDFKNLYLVSQGQLKKVDISKGSATPIAFEADFNMRPDDERAYIFDHAWRQVKDKFYVADLHGADWEMYRQAYRRFLPYINNNYDFQELLSEMLGELNASHTGARYYPGGPNLPTSSLGLFFDDGYTGKGLKVDEVIKRGPFAVRKTDVTAGCIIESIDGTEIEPNMDYNSLLDGKAGKKVTVGVYNPMSGKRFTTVVKPVSRGELNELLYKRWVDRNRQLVDSLSHGRLAYVHVKAMNSESFRTVYEELLSDKNRNRDAVIVDERHNGGGWLHDDLCTLLSGKQYQSFVPKGKYVGRDPFNKWTKPSCVLICEDDYSNGHGFPLVYKTLGIGPLIGTPVAGTMTAVWWETQIDPSIVFGIPQVGCVDMNGNYGENQTLYPDIEVYNTPEDFLNGYDRQLEKAVKVMLEKTSSK